MHFSHTLALLALPTLAYGQLFRPAAAPIITRSPYLNAWIDLSSAQSSIPNNFPQFWSGDHILGLAGFLRVDDGDTYEWMGGAMENADLNFTAKSRQAARLDNLIITATQTILVLSAGPIQFNITYLSPIESSDIALQSFPFSYVFFDAVSTDNMPHHVQVYSDITGEWLSFSQDVIFQWDTAVSPIITHSAQLSTEHELQENTNMSSDGVLYFSTNPGNEVTWQTGGHFSLRGWFLSQGYLNNTKDTKFRNINDNYPVLAYAHDLGAITKASIVWAVGYVRKYVIQDTIGGSGVRLPGYWITKFNNDTRTGIQTFLSDASAARERANALDQKILNDANKVSSNYGNLVSLAARQTFAGVERAVGPNNSVYMFMKDVGSSQRVNPVETLYAAFPAFLYINSTWGQYLLEPLLQYQTSTQYTPSYAAPDIGIFYPIAAGNSNPSVLRSLDDSSSMLIMAWAQARFSGDKTLLNQYYSTFQKWADYIISSNPLHTSGETVQTSDGLDSHNMTNLAIKGIIGVRAMAEISHTLGRSDDASKYQNQASLWVSNWQELAVSNNHLVSTYSEPDSWALMYNLYPDVWLGMNLVSSEVYNAQDQFYVTKALSGGKFGLPFDSNKTIVKSHWTMFTAATTKNPQAQDSLIEMIYNKAIDRSSFAAFPSTYGSIDGKVISGLASPAQGATFSFLALNLDSKIAGISGNTTPSSSNKNNIGAIAGGIVGGLAGLAFIIIGFLFFIQRSSKLKSQNYMAQGVTVAHGRYQHSDNSSSRPMKITPLILYNESQSTMQQVYPPPKRRGHAQENSMPVANAVHSDNSHSRSILRSPSIVTSTDTSRLRDELESLRQEMEEARARTMYEPPPQYDM